MAGPDQNRLGGASAEGQPESGRERADGADGHGAKDRPKGNLASPRTDRPACDGNPVETSLVPPVLWGFKVFGGCGIVCVTPSTPRRSHFMAHNQLYMGR